MPSLNTKFQLSQLLTCFVFTLDPPTLPRCLLQEVCIRAAVVVKIISRVFPLSPDRNFFIMKEVNGQRIFYQCFNNNCCASSFLSRSRSTTSCSNCLAFWLSPG